MAPPGKPASESRVTMTEIVIPEDTNARGTIFGGRVMALIDKAAAVVGMRHARTEVVTASVDQLVFHSPIHLGGIVVLEASLCGVFRSSMEVGVKVESEDPRTGTRRHTTTAYVTVVSVDDEGRPVPAPPLRLVDDADRERAEAAARRREARLKDRNSPGS